MAATVSLKQIRDDIRSLADQPEEADPFDTNQELNRMINRSLKRWYTEVARACPERYETVQSITANSTGPASASVFYNGYCLLPSDHMTTLFVDRVVSSRRIPVDLLMPQERNAWSGTNGDAIGYRVIRDRLYMMPAPTSGSYELRYVPAFQDLVSDTDTVDGINGWEQWVVYDVVYQAFVKEETDVNAIKADRDQLWVEIQNAIELREHGNPTRIVDTRNKDPFGRNLPKLVIDV
jgi:hypothetical protein